MKARRINVLRVAIITIVLIDITIAVLLLYRPKFPKVEGGKVVPLQIAPVVIGINEMVNPPIPFAALSNYCTLHRQPRIEAVVPLKYGLPMTDSNYWVRIKAEHDLFPNAWNRVQAGCTVYSAKTTLVRYCPQCREAEKVWQKRQNSSIRKKI